MNLFSNKKILGPLVFGLTGLSALLFFYIVGSDYLAKQKQSETLNKINNFESTSSSISKNFTAELAKNVIQKVAETNIENSSVDAIKLPNKTLINEAVEASLKNFNPESIKPEIKDNSLKISDDTSVKSISSYFSEFQKIIVNNSLSVNNLNSKTTVSNALASLIFSYEKMIEEFYALSVPRSVISFHKEEISLLSAKLLVLKQLQNYEKDPLLTLLAVKSDEYFDSKFLELKDSINDYLLKNNITF
ncbi:MAG: hypothetical protein PHZ25_00590 [Candidatus Pacebacteria bacterium]|nr:hypothetical protein [Candidatus Paceibacterota bacterium]